MDVYRVVYIRVVLGRCARLLKGTLPVYSRCDPEVSRRRNDWVSSLVANEIVFVFIEVADYVLLEGKTTVSIVYASLESMSKEKIVPL